MRTAEELLRRLATQPGIILADEVGMGKTFVALAAAMSAIWSDKGKRPVVVMVPTSVQRKWVRDFGVFREKCLPNAADRDLRMAEASNALEYFKLLDDTPAKRARLIFLSHGAFHRSLQDPWNKLAILKFAMHHAKLGDRRKTLPRFAADLLRTKGSYSKPELFQKLLDSDFERWRSILSQFGEDPGDDPVPESVAKALLRSKVDLSELRTALGELPLRESKNLEERLRDVRRALSNSLQHVWQEALMNASFRSPLLILDEAHHVKNPATKLASLFVSEQDNEEARMLSGALEGGFERMLFLTATPFQLGHSELLNVIDRFQGIDWKTLEMDVGRERFAMERKALSDSLDEAQRTAVELDWQWGKLRRSDLVDSTEQGIEAWWKDALSNVADQPERVQQVIRSYKRTFEALRISEQRLRPWVIRHTRARILADTTVPRRQRMPGLGIRTSSTTESTGLPIADNALLPFLLASRAQAVVAHVARATHDQKVYRATFAEGLASSYETFLETRSHDEESLDEHGPVAETPTDQRLTHYLERLRESLPDESSFAEHPKVAATVNRVVELWSSGEKVVVFCHYRVTGRALVKHISNALSQRLWDGASKRLGVAEATVRELADAWSEGFEVDRPLGRTIRSTVIQLLEPISAIDAEEADRIADIVRRFVRTPLFLARYVDLTQEDRAASLERALQEGGAHSLRGRVEGFAKFLARLTRDERAKYLEALGRIHPGPQYEAPDVGEHHAGAALQPNVRLASGAVRPEVRERLLLGFNTPFFPEVLVASSVMAEGVDLHLNCRHMIHHDLDWNPSVLEQRTGRVDRINSKAEKVGRSIEVYLPYVGGTQDEKMYRVVMDRERWFQIVMGEEFKTDEYATEQIADRVPLPASIAKELSLRLEATNMLASDS